MDQQTKKRKTKAQKERAHTMRAVLAAVIILAAAALIYIYADKDALRQAADGVFSGESAPDTSAFTADIPVPSPMPDKPYLDIYFFDVGQGDSILMISPSGKTMLVDAGDAEHTLKLARCLDKLGVTELDALVATHPHSDHIGGMRALIESMKVNAFYMPDAENTTSAYEGMISALYEKNVPSAVIAAGTPPAIAWDGEIAIQVLSPFDKCDFGDLNDHSLILSVTYGGRTLLLTGDAGKEGEEAAMNMLGASAFRADILKVPHHGSDWGCSEAFIGAIDPKIAVISCGKNNDYGHPDSATLDILEKSGAAVFRTDEDGTVRVIITADGVITVAASKR